MKTVLVSDIQYLIELGHNFNDEPVSVIDDSNAIGVIIDSKEFSRLKRAAGESPVVENTIAAEPLDPLRLLGDIRDRVEKLMVAISGEIKPDDSH